MLSRRNFQEQIQLSQVIVTSLFQTMLNSLLVGLIRRSLALFFDVINQCIFGVFMIINSFPAERASGVYSLFHR